VPYSYSFHPTAAREYEDSFQWYEKKSGVAADNFIIAVQDSINRICSHPFRFRKTHKELRELALKKYPFYVIYLIDENRKQIIIVSIYHNKRNPKEKYIKSSK
jgi:plasmid stabilization system protein ParE